jgi:hypothetical protein
VRVVSDSTAKTATNAILFSWVIRPCVGQVVRNSEVQSDANKQELWHI